MFIYALTIFTPIRTAIDIYLIDLPVSTVVFIFNLFPPSISLYLLSSPTVYLALVRSHPRIYLEYLRRLLFVYFCF